jgi:hypothetical protein
VSLRESCANQAKPAATRSSATIVVTGKPRCSTLEGRSRWSHRDTLRGSVETMI